MRTRPLGGGRVDLCVACGPFIHRGGGFDGAAVGERGRNETDGSDSGSGSGSDSGSDSGSGSSGGGYDNTGGYGYRARRRPAPPSRTGAGVAAGALSRPARRRGTRRRSSRNGRGASSSSSSGSTPEQDAADEGTITSTLAQLENIVCRVLYVPGTGDPPSLRGLLVPRRARRDVPPPGTVPPRRLTPNSRNVQRSWIQLAPGLGVAGLTRDGGGDDDDDDNDNEDGGKDDDGEDDDDGGPGPSRRRRSPGRYERTLGALLGLAPPSASASVSSSRIFSTRPSQAIVLTDFPGGRLGGGRRRGKRDKDDARSASARAAGGGMAMVRRGYRELLEPALARDPGRGGGGGGGGQVLLKVAPPPPTAAAGDDGAGRFDAFGTSSDELRPLECDGEDGMKLIMPGSLRQRGDFALIDLALCKEGKDRDTSDDDKPGGRDGATGRPSRDRKLAPPFYRWQVHRVQFRSMGPLYVA